MKNNNLWISDLLAFDGYIILNKTLVKQLGLNNSAFICELCSEFKYYLNNNKLVDNEWFYSTIPNIEENVGLTRYQQEECTKKLEKLDIITTKIMGMPSKRYFKINWKVLEKYIKKNEQKTTKCQKSTKKSPKIQGCEKLANKVAKNQQTRMQKTNNQGCKKLTSKVAKKQQPNLQETSNQGCKKPTIKDAKNQQPSMQETNKQGCEKLATNNNNITILNNNNNKTLINNNLISSQNTKVTDLSKIKNMKDLRKEQKRKDELSYSFKANNEILQEFQKNIEIEKLTKNYKSNHFENEKYVIFNTFINQITEIIQSNKEYYIITGEKVSTNNLKNDILSLNSEDINIMINNYNKNKNKVKNIRAYILSVIYNGIKYKDINKSKIPNTREKYNALFAESVKKRDEQQLKEE